MTAAAAAAGDAGAAVRRARIAVTAVFVLFGVNVGTWAVHIPLVQARLAIEPAILGLALLGSAIGSVVAQPAVGYLMTAVGSRLPTVVILIVSTMLLPLPIISPSVPFLFGAAAALGAIWGGLNVCMNTQATEVETARARPTMSTFHAGASLGMLAGATVGGILIARGLGDGRGAALVSAAGFVGALIAISWLLRTAPATRERRRPAFVLPNRAVMGLGALAFLTVSIEGGITDWGALFLARSRGADPALAAVGYAMFSVAMVTLRVFGNRVVTAFGRRATLMAGGILVTLGIAIAVLSPSIVMSAVGFAIVGLGAANTYPILISAAGATPGVPPSVAVSAVSSVGVLGFLVGPPIIGFVSSAFGLGAGIALLGFAGAAVALVATFRTWPNAPRA